MMMADTLEALGIKRGDYVIRVNNRKVLDGVMEAIGVDDPAKKLTVLRALDKHDKFGAEGVLLLLGDGRKDESGDFTKGAGLNDEQIRLIVPFLAGSTMVPADQSRSRVRPLVGRPSKEDGIRWVNNSWNSIEAARLIVGSTPSGAAGIEELELMLNLFEQSGYGPDRIAINTTVIRGLEYYTGPVYEAELTFDVTNEKGEKVVFGSVGGGGRYDGLVSRFMGQPVPATGFSIGVSRLMTALKNLGKLGQSEVVEPVLVTVMDGDIEAMGRYQRMTQELRAAGIRAEMFQGNWKKFGNQLKYADRRGCPVAVIQGADERAQGVVQIKDLIEGKRLSGEIEDNAAWREARVAQETVPEADLVAKVKEILAAQAEDRKRAGNAQ
jgi:histidyl-tRNA synthetase